MPSKKPPSTSPTKKTPRKKAPKKRVGELPLLPHFPRVPPVPVLGSPLPLPGKRGSWDDVFDRFPTSPPTPSIATSHWLAQSSFVRFEPDNVLTYGAPGGISEMEWRQHGPWVLLHNKGPHTRMVEILAYVDGDNLAGYHRSSLFMAAVNYQRTAAAPIDEFIRGQQALDTWLQGPRDTPKPPIPTWPHERQHR